MIPWVEIVIYSIIGAVGGGTLATLLNQNLGAIAGIWVGAILGALGAVAFGSMLMFLSGERESLEQILFGYIALTIWGAPIGAFFGAKHFIVQYARALVDGKNAWMVRVLRTTTVAAGIIGALFGVLNSGSIPFQETSENNIAAILLTFVTGGIVGLIMFESARTHEAAQKEAITKLVYQSIDKGRADKSHCAPNNDIGTVRGDEKHIAGLDDALPSKSAGDNSSYLTPSTIGVGTRQSEN